MSTGHEICKRTILKNAVISPGFYSTPCRSRSSGLITLWRVYSRRIAFEGGVKGSPDLQVDAFKICHNFSEIYPASYRLMQVLILGAYYAMTRLFPRKCVWGHCQRVIMRSDEKCPPAIFRASKGVESDRTGRGNALRIEIMKKRRFAYMRHFYTYTQHWNENVVVKFFTPSKCLQTTKSSMDTARLFFEKIRPYTGRKT